MSDAADMPSRSRDNLRRGGGAARIPIAIVVIAAALIAFLHFNERIETYIAFWAMTAVLVFTAVALVLWFALSSAFTGRTRVRGLLAMAAVLIGAAVVMPMITRVDGTLNGVGIPKLAWKWSQRTGEGLTAMPVIDADPKVKVDLSATTPWDSPEFLGPGRRNDIQGVHLSRDWSHPPRQLWRQPIGLGWSSFAVVGPWAVTQEQRGQRELVVCYEVATGKARWEHVHENTRFSEWQGGDGPRATPTIAGGRVFAVGATGFLDCLDGATGKVIWSHNVLAETGSGNLSYGKSDSPLIVDDLVIVTGGSGGPSLLAYNKDSGAPAWSGDRETPGYASPVLATIAGARQILTINGNSAAAADPADGHLLWRFDWPGTMPKSTQPVALPGDRVLLSAGYGIGTVVLHVVSAGGNFAVDPVWQNRRLKPKFSNLAVRGNYVYGLDDGTLVCLDLATGNRMWRGEHYGFGQLLLADDLLLVQSEPGDVVLVEANPAEFKELGRFPALSDKTWTQPVLAGHRLLVRNDREAACYELP